MERIHKKAVQQLLFHEGFLQREKIHPIGPPAKEFAEYNRAVWRKVNDSIVWSLLGVERHRVKRLCLFRRYNLMECNPDAARGTVEELNKTPTALALWSDATWCGDVGDIMYIRDRRRPEPEFIELKEGEVNAAILDALRAPEPCKEAHIQYVERRYGKKGLQQMQRVIRQTAQLHCRSTTQLAATATSDGASSCVRNAAARARSVTATGNAVQPDVAALVERCLVHMLPFHL